MTKIDPQGLPRLRSGTWLVQGANYATLMARALWIKALGRRDRDLRRPRAVWRTANQ